MELISFFSVWLMNTVELVMWRDLPYMRPIYATFTFVEAAQLNKILYKSIHLYQYIQLASVHGMASF